MNRIKTGAVKLGRVKAGFQFVLVVIVTIIIFSLGMYSLYKYIILDEDDDERPSLKGSLSLIGVSFLIFSIGYLRYWVIRRSDNFAVYNLL